jgi:hypothetical protein
MRIRTALSWAFYWFSGVCSRASWRTECWSLTLQGNDLAGPWGAWDDPDNKFPVPDWSDKHWVEWPVDNEHEFQLKLFDALHELGNGYDKRNNA